MVGFVTDGIFYSIIAIIILIATSDHLVNFLSLITKKKEQLREWLKPLSGLRKTYFGLGSVAIVILFGLFIFLLIKFVQAINNASPLFPNLAVAFFATLSGFGALFGFYTSIIRTETAEQGQITDRINKAVEGLGRSNLKDEPVVEVRLGALYALERIAQDSIRDHVQIMEILCSYIRHNSPWSNRPSEVERLQDMEQEKKKEKKVNKKFEPDGLREDIQAALTIIGRRKSWPEITQRMKIEKAQKYIIDLTNCDLHRARIENADLCDAKIIDSNLTRAIIKNTDFTGARICVVDITSAILTNITMQDTDMTTSFAYEGDFVKCSFTPKQINSMFLGKKVKLHKDLKHPQKDLNDYPNYFIFMNKYYTWLGTRNIK